MAVTVVQSNAQSFNCFIIGEQIWQQSRINCPDITALKSNTFCELFDSRHQGGCKKRWT
jgi:hypothetical protein